MNLERLTVPRVDRGKSGTYTKGRPLPSIYGVISACTLLIFELHKKTGVIYRIRYVPSSTSYFLILQSVFNFKSRRGVNRESPGEIRDDRGKSGITCILRA